MGQRVHASLRIERGTGRTQLTLRTGPLLTEPYRRMDLLRSLHFWQKTVMHGYTKPSRNEAPLFSDQYTQLPRERGDSLEERILSFRPERQDRMVMGRAFYELKFYSVGQFANPNRLQLRLENGERDGWVVVHDAWYREHSGVSNSPWATPKFALNLLKASRSNPKTSSQGDSPGQFSP